MTSQTTAVLAFAVLGAVFGPLTAWVAARRAVAQPLAVDSAAERRLLAAVVTDPVRVHEAYDATGIEARHFAHAGRAAVWAAIVAAEQRATDGAGPDQILDAARAELAGNPEGLAQLERAVALAAGDDRFGDGPLRDDDAALIVLDAEDRDRYPAGAGVVAGDGEDPLVRVWRKPGRLRLTVAAASCAAGFALSAWLAPAQGPRAFWSVVALCAVVLVGYFVAAVDHDTLYLDHLGFWSGSVVAWALAAVACISGGRTGDLMIGVAAAGAWAVGFELLNAAYKLLRGVPGQGLGDTFIVLTCTGVPAAVAGDLLVGVTSVMAGAVAALAVGIVKIARSERGMQTPFAFGPYLAIGWALAWSALRLTGKAS